MDAQAAVQSPFLPGTNIQFAWDSTCLGYIKICPRLYQYTIIEGWSPKDESVHLRFGSEYHQAIQEYDIERANGTSHEDAIRNAIKDLLVRTRDWIVDEGTKAGHYKNRRTLLQLCIDYFDYFKDDMFIGMTAPEFTESTDWVEVSTTSELSSHPEATHITATLVGGSGEYEAWFDDVSIVEKK